MTPVGPKLLLENIGKMRKSRWLYRGLDLAVNGGEVVVIAGPNGSGKTTLLSIAAGLLEPDEGSVILKGVDIYSLPINERIKYAARLVAFSFQEPLLINELTALENIVFTLTGVGVNRGEAVKAAREALDLVDIPAETKPSKMSGGERKRTDIARAIAKVYAGVSEVLVLDEPTAYVDERYATVVLDEVEKLAKRRSVAVLVSTVDDERVFSRASRIVRLGSQGV